MRGGCRAPRCPSLLPEDHPRALLTATTTVPVSSLGGGFPPSGRCLRNQQFPPASFLWMKYKSRHRDASGRSRHRVAQAGGRAPNGKPRRSLELAGQPLTTCSRSPMCSARCSVKGAGREGRGVGLGPLWGGLGWGPWRGGGGLPSGGGTEPLGSLRCVLSKVLGSPPLPRGPFPLLDRPTSAPPCPSPPPSCPLGLLLGRDPQEPGLAPDAMSWSAFWPSCHLPGRATGAVPARCQACPQPTLIDLISSRLARQILVHPGPWPSPCALAPSACR